MTLSVSGVAFAAESTAYAAETTLKQAEKTDFPLTIEMQFQAILLYQKVKDGAVIKISNIGLYMDRTIHC